MQEHIRDNDAMIEFHKNTTNAGPIVNYGDIAAEVLSYCIIAAPVRPTILSSTTPGENYAPYSLQLGFRINGIIYPKGDAISRSLGVHLK